MNRIIAIVTSAALVLPLLGCPQQSTIANLTNTLGTAAARIAILQGDPVLGNRITVDKEAAVAAITNWKPGSNSDMAIQALNLVMDDLNLIPAASPYAALIDIAIITAQGIIAELAPAASPAVVNPEPQAQRAPRARRQPKVSAPAPKTDKEFKQQWNAVVAQKQLPATAAIK